MKNLLIILVVTFASILTISAQRGYPATAPTPAPGTGSIDSDRQKDTSGRSDNLKLTEKFPVHTDANSKIFRESIRPIYRGLKKDEKELLAPDATETEKYAQFLNQKKAGLVKIIADQGCDKSFGVIVSSVHCAQYSMPGAGSSYSFRERDYRSRFLGDVLYTGQLLKSVGTLIHGIFVDLGDLPIEQVGPQTEGVVFVMNFAPSTNMNSATETTDKLIKGIQDGKFTYQSYVEVAENRTYVLRSIAYRGNNLRTVLGTTYNELDFDKRKDVTVAFRVVRIDGESAVTILWRELGEQKSPKIADEKD